jgi:predicted RNA methylase
MAADVDRIVRNLLSFYDFSDKVIVSVGAGGGQLVEYGRAARQVVALDSDHEAVDRLKKNLWRVGLNRQFRVVEGDFYDFSSQGDVVLFEFSLHEMQDPARALRHAHTLAPDVVVIDHLPESEWAFFASEEDKVRASWDAILERGVKIRATFSAAQRFADHQELHKKVGCQGEKSIARIQKFIGEKDIAIRMPYGIVLV